MKKKLISFVILVLTMTSNILAIKGYEVEEQNEYKLSAFTLRVKIFEPDDIYQENYPKDEEVITNSAWINRAIEELSSKIGYISPFAFDIPLEKTEIYDASQLDENKFILLGSNQRFWTFQTIDNNDQQGISIEVDNSGIEMGSSEEFAIIGIIAKTLDNSLTLDEIFTSYQENFKSNQAYQIGSVTIQRLDNSFKLERDLTEEISKKTYPNYAQSVPTEQNGDVLISLETIEEYKEEQAWLKENHHNVANEYLIQKLTDDDNYSFRDYDFNSYNYTLDDIPNIFSEDYPEIENPILNREWLNRILVEIVKINGTSEAVEGIYNYGEDSNTAYYYPNNGAEIYLYSGIFDNRHKVEIRYAANVSDNYMDKILENDNEYNGLLNRFKLYAKILDNSLTEAEIESGFNTFLENDNNFNLGTITVYQEGLLPNVIYFSRDITDEIEQGEFPNYTESLANTNKNSLLDNEGNLLGEIEIVPNIISEQYVINEDMLDALNYSSYYSTALNNYKEYYNVNFSSHNLVGSIEEINKEDDYIYLKVNLYPNSGYLHKRSSILLQVPEELIKEDLKYGDQIKALVRNEGIRDDQFKQLLEFYSLISPESLEINK